MAIQPATQVAEHNFRSLEEMERMVDDIGEEVDNLGELVDKYETQFNKSTATTAGIELKINSTPGVSRKKKIIDAIDTWDRVTIPNLDRLKANFSVVDELYEKLDVLQSLEASLKSNFKARHGAGSVLAGIQRLRKVTEAKIAKALRFLQNIAVKHVPPYFGSLVDDTLEEISAKIKYDKYETFLYVHPNPAGHFQFTAYVRLQHIIDDEGQAYPDLFIVFTCELFPIANKQVELRYYVTVLHDFLTPGKFEPGTQVANSKAAITLIGSLLELENFANSLGVVPMPVEPGLSKNNFSMKDKISSLEADEHAIEFVLVPAIKDPKEAEAIAIQLNAEVRAMFLKLRAKLKMRVVKVSGRFHVSFTLANLADPSQVSVNDLEFLRTKLGVDDAKLRRIVKVINGH